MDITDEFGLEFLDLTDVDEYERHRVLSSLQPAQTNVRFPWFIGDEQTNTESGIKSTKPSTHSLPQPETNSHNYIPLITKTPRRPLPIIDPENGLVIPLNNKTEPENSSAPITANPLINVVNGPGNPQVNNQYYTPVPQYYAPAPVVTTLPSVPVHIPPTNYGNYTHNTNHPELPTNTTIYPTYMTPTYPVKAPVFYGVPPTQPIFVSHPPAADTGNYYQNSTTPYVASTVPLEAKVALGAQEVTLPEEEWGTLTNSVKNAALTPAVQNIADTVQNQSNPSKKPVSPLSAETPAFTPKNQQNLPGDIQSGPTPTPVEVQKHEPELQTVENTESIALVENLQPAQLTDQQISTPKQGGVWGAGKSWASLFTPKEGSVSSPTINGVTKAPFSGAVGKGSSNNEVVCPIKNPKRNHFIDPDCYRMGEFLTNYTVDGRAISLQPRGLINQSNYCYINSILQALIACPPMYNLLSGLADNISSNAKRKPTPVIDGMCKFVKEYNHLPANMRVNNRRSDGGKKDQKKDQGAMINTDIPFEPSWIYKILHGLQTDLVEGRQEDAEEFLGCLLNNLSDEMLELIKLVESSEKTPTREPEDEGDMWQVMGSKNKGSVLRKTEFERTPITDIFGGSLKSKINRIGGTITENTQPFLTLPLNIEKVKTVREALEALTTKYQLEGLTSAKTNEEVEAWQQVMLDELPVVLVLHLKCFDFQLDGCTKIVKALEFPIDLKIDAKLLSSKTANAKEKQYKLFAVVYHDGKEATKGHYVTDAFHVGYSSWLRYDDASVKPVQEENVLNPQGTRVPYLLFYRRSDTIRGR